MRYFNTAGPCDPERHYMLPAKERLPRARRLIERDQYVVVHAPRQTGKTTTLRELARDLTAAGGHAALWFSCERVRGGQDPAAAEVLVLEAIRRATLDQGWPAEWLPPDPWPESVPGARLGAGLAEWARSCPRPLVLFFDEFDVVTGNPMLNMLSQIRAGYPLRPGNFPSTIVLCGMRDVRDYKMGPGQDATTLGSSSPFNIKVSVRIDDFTAAEVAELYAQHTAETGQEFTPDAVRRAFDDTQGQPWLVNSLAAEIIDEMGVAPPEPITADHMDRARERLILARATHLDSLVARLAEPRVRRVIEPIVAGTETHADAAYNDDVSYVQDLGLIAPDRPLRPANPIYKEVIARVLADYVNTRIRVTPRSFLLGDGRLDMARLWEEFATWWKQNGEFLVRNGNYPEAAPQLILMGFLHRVVNGGGFIDREYGLGRGRVDLLIRKPCTGPDGRPALQREGVEIKARHPGEPDPTQDGLTQLDRYLDRLDLPTGALAIFDARPDAEPIHQRTTITTTQTPTGRTITLFHG